MVVVWTDIQEQLCRVVTRGRVAYLTRVLSNNRDLDKLQVWPFTHLYPETKCTLMTGTPAEEQQINKSTFYFKAFNTSMFGGGKGM